MEHIIEAYDLLVDKLKAKINDDCNKSNGHMHENSRINHLLTSQLVKYAGKKAAMEIALVIDKEFDVGFAEWVDEEYEEKVKK